ncbi:MAG: type II secretion system protein [Bdellovibrionales bacterium]
MARRSHKYQSDTGFGLIELLVAVAIISVILLSIGELNLQMHKTSIQAGTGVDVDILRRNIVSVSLDTNSWTATLVAGSPAVGGGMTCLNLSQPCEVAGVPIADQSFALLDAVGNTVFDSTLPNNGFAYDGSLCTTFSKVAGAGSDDCPFHYDLTWTAYCNPGACVNPLVKIHAKLFFNPATQHLVFNPNRYAIPDFVRPAK